MKNNWSIARERACGITRNVRVGLKTDKSICISFDGFYQVSIDGHKEEGSFENNNGKQFKFSANDLNGHILRFEPKDVMTCYFKVENIEIGTDFHWQENLTLNYRGVAELRPTNDGKVQLINDIPLELYIRSVIGSEMSPQCPPELLKAHAIISRSWLVSQLQRKENLRHPIYRRNKLTQNDNELIKIWDALGHTDYDVCSDDHCQRYQGVNSGEEGGVSEAIKETEGLILSYEGLVCDARFSKCCGGISEQFSVCWTDEDYGYLSPVRCNAENTNAKGLIRDKISLRDWIENPPYDTYCSSNDGSILKKILKSYDQKTESNLYRWEVSYTQDELSELVKSKTGIDFGRILSLEPVSIGKSGRISRLEIVGTLKTLVIGKELMIRRALSKSHLLSSAFIVDKVNENGNTVFVIKGAGWGHGVGMCQVGAAVMAEKGYTYDQILALYYPGSEIHKMADSIDTL